MQWFGYVIDSKPIFEVNNRPNWYVFGSGTSNRDDHGSEVEFA